MGGGLKGTGCRWLWGMKSLNRSLTSPTEPALFSWGWIKSLRYDPHEWCQVRVRLCTVAGTWGGWVCGQSGWVHAFFVFLKKRIHKVWTTQTPYRAYYMWGDTLVDMHTHTRRMYTHATRMHTNTHFPITSLFAPYPFPLKLPHTHKIWLNYPGVLSPACLLILFVFAEGALFSLLLCPCSISLCFGFHTSAIHTGFLIFFPLVPILLGCFTQLNTVYFGKG